MAELATVLSVLVGNYSYYNALQLARAFDHSSKELHFLLELMKERRELNVDFIFAHEQQVQSIEDKYQIRLVSNDLENERLANYIMDLEAKVRNGNIIDFVRAVSPILYRLFLAILKEEVPDIESYIKNSKNAKYDKWERKLIDKSDDPKLKVIFSDWIDFKVTTESLAECIQRTQARPEIKQTVLNLREFERSVRNPLAHLIKAFDEEELHRTTGFSSQEFLNQIIYLAKQVGIVYDTREFHFDKINRIIITQILNEE